MTMIVKEDLTLKILVFHGNWEGGSQTTLVHVGGNLIDQAKY